MDKNDLESKKLPELRDLAKMLGIEGTETFKKPELIEAIAGGSSSKDSDDSPKRKRTRKKVMTDTSENTPEEVKPQIFEKPDVYFDDEYQDAVEKVKKPWVTQNTGNNEWYTPPVFIEAARAVMGSIDTDPASCETANQNVKANNVNALIRWVAKR